MDKQNDRVALACGPVGDPMAVQDDLVCLWLEVGQAEAPGLVGFSGGSDDALLGR
jgi:hypothetical protein